MTYKDKGSHESSPPCSPGVAIGVIRSDSSRSIMTYNSVVCGGRGARVKANYGVTVSLSGGDLGMCVDNGINVW